MDTPTLLPPSNPHLLLYTTDPIMFPGRPRTPKYLQEVNLALLIATTPCNTQRPHVYVYTSRAPKH